MESLMYVNVDQRRC